MANNKSSTIDDPSGGSAGSVGQTVSEESIFVEFFAAIDSQLFNSNLNSIKFMGLDSDQVVLQMCGNTFFSGHFEHIFGTNVLFEVKDNQKNESRDGAEANEKPKSLHYIGKCDQKLVMKRVFLESHESHPNQSNDSIDSQNEQSVD